MKDGQRVYSEVKTFLKHLPYVNATYLKLTTEQGNQVTLTGNHLLFVSPNNKSTDMKTRYVEIYFQSFILKSSDMDVT